MQCDYLRTKIRGAINYRGLMVHDIAHVAFFFNGLMLLMIMNSRICCFGNPFYKQVLVSINHILPGNEAN